MTSTTARLSETQRVDIHDPGIPPTPLARPETPLHAHGAATKTTRVRIGDVTLGGGGCQVIAGPCAIEDLGTLETVADAVWSAGGKLLRGGAYKPRTSPYSFQGLGVTGLEMLRDVGKARGLGVISEVMAPELVPVVAEYVDALQIGARNMQNYALLEAVGRSRTPVVLKRGMGSTLDELLWAAEHILARGNDLVVLCERGIRTFESATRTTLDLSAIPVLQERTHLPVIVDPSHAAGDRRYVPALARAAHAVGADGLIIEIHPNPARALSDGPQALTLPMWHDLARDLGMVAPSLGSVKMLGRATGGR